MSLLKERRRLHGARFERLDGHGGSVVPETFKDLTKLTTSESSYEGDGASRNLPHVFRLVREIYLWFLELCARLAEVDAQPVAVMAVVVN